MATPEINILCGCTCGCDCPIYGDEADSTIICFAHNHQTYCRECVGCMIAEINNASEESVHSAHICKHGTDIETNCCEDCISEQNEPVHQSDPNSELPIDQ